jgi:CRP/FNR family transcriptional regulator
MLNMIVNNDVKVKNSELDAYGIRHNFVGDDFAGKEILRHLKTTKKIYLSPQQVIFNDSTEADTIYIIQKGLVKLLTYLPNGRARIVRLLGPGCVLGLSGIFDHIHKHKAVAVHDVVLVKIAAGSITSIRQQYPDVYLRIMEKMYEDVNIADTWITQFSTGSIKARVARLITFLSYMENESPPDIVELLTCEEMASILGVTPESVSRVLASFKRQQILQRTGDEGEIYRRDSRVLLELSQDIRPEHPKQFSDNKTGKVFLTGS